MERLKLQKMMDFVREGDIVVVHSFDRLARNVKDLLELVERLKTKGVQLISKKEGLDTTSPIGKMMLTVLGALYEMERENILERAREGREVAKAKGVKFGRPEKMLDNFDMVYYNWKSGKITASKASRELNIARSTFYSHIKKFEETLGEMNSAED